MRLINAPLKARAPDTRGAHSTVARLRRPTKLPTVLPTTSLGRYLQRLHWLFGRG
jgi:hypothetical protein